MDQLRPSMGDYARRYLAAGWPPLELPAGAKAPPPEGRTGYQGVDMTLAEVEAAPWTGNLGARMPPDAIGLDFDHYRGGKETLHALNERCGRLPLTFLSHSNRNDGSGIRYFRVPVGRIFVHALPGMEVIQRTHRYSVMPPSMHPDGRAYAWWNQAEGAPLEGVPRVEDLPELPWPWIEALTAPSQANGHEHHEAEDHELRAFLEAHQAAEAPNYLYAVIVAHFAEQVAAGHSRHDTMTHCLTWGMEASAAGICSARAAIDALGAAWGPTHTDPWRAELSNPHRVTEFQGMVRWAVGKVLAKSEQELAVLHDKVCGPRFMVAEVLDQTHHEAEDDDGMVTLIDWTGKLDSGLELVEGLVFTGRWTQLVAPAKAGKSTVALWMQTELTEGRDALDASPVEPVVALFVNGEMSKGDLWSLVLDMGHEPVGLTNWHATEERLRLDRSDGAERLLRRVDALGARFVLIDGLNGVLDPGVTENDDTIWRKFYEHTIAPLKRRMVAIASTDNMGKDPLKGARGSSVKNDKADAVVAVTRTDNGARLRVTHGRGGHFADKVELAAVGFDRSQPISYRRVAGSWPVGTKEAAAELDRLSIPLDWGRDRVRERLRDDAIPMANDVLSAAIRWRKASS